MAKEALKTHDLLFYGWPAYVSHKKLSYNGLDVAFPPYESQGMMGGFFISDHLPSLSWIDKLSGMFARLENNFKDLDLFYQELIDEHLNPNRPETMKDDVLDILIQIKQEQSSGFALSWDHIKALLMNIFIAGTETSAATVVWAMTALMKNPSALKKVQADIRDLVGQKGAVVEEKLQKLHYLDAVIKEALRLGNDFEVIPSGAGRRGCPGISLGRSIVKLALANLLYSFEWESPSGIRTEDVHTNVLPGITRKMRFEFWPSNISIKALNTAESEH
ncbi:5-OH-xanthotoxin synthase-like [Coffea arabica]|uniref:5-OH-xanthotoxin synthase-like n=1 Tax=Coffea arabica TaxID=13443 RepID=A0A6P6T2B0_COFAR|nr:cytochrome P450 83B1-like [Coffea arabica]